MRRRYLVLLVFLSVLVSPVSADFTITFEDVSVTYNDNAEIEAVCERDGGECPGQRTDSSIEVEANCESDFRFPMNVETGSRGAVYSVDPKVPGGNPCGQGDYDMELFEVVDGSEELLAEATLTVEARNMDAHVGKNLIINMEPDDYGGGELRNIQLTDDIWGYHHAEEAGWEQGAVMLQEYGAGRITSDRQTYRLDEDQGEVGDAPVFGTNTEQDYSTSVIYGFVDMYNHFEEGDGDELSFDFMFTAFARDGFTWSYGSGVTDWVDSQSPVHEDGRYYPDGDIIIGYYPAYFDEDGETGEHRDGKPYFFVCREGATMDNGFGEEVPQVVDVTFDGGDRDLYRCNPDKALNGEGEGYWEPVPACDSGIDNDGDGRLDHRDSWYHDEYDGAGSWDRDCGSADDPSELEIMECSPEVQAKDRDGDPEKVVRTGEMTVDGECEYDEDDWVETVPEAEDRYEEYDEPEVFKCEWRTDVELVPGLSIIRTVEYDGSDNDRAEQFCEDMYDENRERYYEDHMETEDGYAFHAVEYYVHPDYVPYGEEYATEDGFKVVNYQALHDAEAKYYESVEVDSTNNPNNCIHDGVSQFCVSTEHNDASYEPLGMTNLHGYENHEPVDYIDAWNVANAGAEESGRVHSRGSTVDEETFFPGGFAGECEEGTRWAYEEDDNRWYCTGEVSWEQSVLLPEVRSDDDTINVGVVIMPYNVEDSTGPAFDDIRVELGRWDLRSYKEAYDESHEDVTSSEVEDRSIAEVEATCFPGTNEEEVEEGDMFTRSVEISPDTGEPQPVPIYGEIPADSDTYTCGWEFTTVGGHTVSEQGDLTMLQDVSQSDDLFTFFSDRHSDDEVNLRQSYSSGGFQNAAETWIEASEGFITKAEGW